MRAVDLRVVATPRLLAARVPLSTPGRLPINLRPCRSPEVETMKAAALLCLLACAGYAAACAHTYTHSRGLMAVRFWLASAACVAIRCLSQCGVICGLRTAPGVPPPFPPHCRGRRTDFSPLPRICLLLPAAADLCHCSAPCSQVGCPYNHIQAGWDWKAQVRPVAAALLPQPTISPQDGPPGTWAT